MQHLKHIWPPEVAGPIPVELQLNKGGWLVAYKKCCVSDSEYMSKNIFCDGPRKSQQNKYISSAPIDRWLIGWTADTVLSSWVRFKKWPAQIIKSDHTCCFTGELHSINQVSAHSERCTVKSSYHQHSIRPFILTVAIVSVYKYKMSDSTTVGGDMHHFSKLLPDLHPCCDCDTSQTPSE